MTHADVAQYDSTLIWPFDRLPTIEWLKEHSQRIHFFGLGFIQIKVSHRERFHFYLRELPAFVEEPHSHRYDFRSVVLAGVLSTFVYRWFGPEGEYLPGRGTACMRVPVTCKPPKPAVTYDEVCIDGVKLSRAAFEFISTPTLPAIEHGFMQHTESFCTQQGSSYWFPKSAYHAVEPWLHAGPTITMVRRGPVELDHAFVLQRPDASRACPFSGRPTSPTEDELWVLVEKALKQVEREGGL